MKDSVKDILKRTPVYQPIRSVWRRFAAPSPQLHDRSDQLVYIHIGKCGGRSLWTAINQSKVVTSTFRSIYRVHIVKPPLLQNAKYLVVVRNPIERALSAFNWRYKLVVEDGAQKDRFEGEHDILSKYGSLNTLAEALYRDGSLDEDVAQDFRSIHHLKEDIAFYLSDLLESISPSQIFAVLVTEFLDSDIERVLGVGEVKRNHENRSSVRKSNLELSDEACGNLRKFLSADYDALTRIFDIDGTDDEKREVVLR